MSIHFINPETKREVSVDTDEFHHVFDEEYGKIRIQSSARPTMAFLQASDQLESIRARHTAYLQMKLDKGVFITQDDIDAAKELEALSIKAQYDPSGQTLEGRHRNTYTIRLDDLDRGIGGPSGVAVWKKILFQAQKAGLLAANASLLDMRTERAQGTA